MITETVVVQFGCDTPGCRLSAVEEGTREKAWERAHRRGWRMKTLSLWRRCADKLCELMAAAPVGKEGDR